MWTFLLMVVHLCLGLLADGNTDVFYLRFASPKQENMIFGTSRAAQGIRPAFIEIPNQEDKKFYNYSFTIMHSPYGEIYTSSILRKLAPTEDGNFIICVDPWSISSHTSAADSDLIFQEKDAEVDKTYFVNWCPNYEYLLENYPYGWGKLLHDRFRKAPSETVLENDGWLSIEIKMDAKSVAERTANKMISYRENCQLFSPDPRRLESLEELILNLKKQGQVYLIRLPVPQEMLKLEKEYMPSFDAEIALLKDAHDLPYYDMTLLPDTFRYTDGNHLYKESGKSVSDLVSDFLSK